MNPLLFVLVLVFLIFLSNCQSSKDDLSKSYQQHQLLFSNPQTKAELKVYDVSFCQNHAYVLVSEKDNTNISLIKSSEKDGQLIQIDQNTSKFTIFNKGNAVHAHMHCSDSQMIIQNIIQEKSRFIKGKKSTYFLSLTQENYENLQQKMKKQPLLSEDANQRYFLLQLQAEKNETEKSNSVTTNQNIQKEAIYHVWYDHDTQKIKIGHKIKEIASQQDSQQQSVDKKKKILDSFQWKIRQINSPLNVADINTKTKAYSKVAMNNKYICMTFQFQQDSKQSILIQCYDLQTLQQIQENVVMPWKSSLYDMEMSQTELFFYTYEQNHVQNQPDNDNLIVFKLPDLVKIIFQQKTLQTPMSLQRSIQISSDERYISTFNGMNLKIYQRYQNPNQGLQYNYKQIKQIRLQLPADNSSAIKQYKIIKFGNANSEKQSQNLFLFDTQFKSYLQVILDDNKQKTIIQTIANQTNQKKQQSSTVNQQNNTIVKPPIQSGIQATNNVTKNQVQINNASTNISDSQKSVKNQEKDSNLNNTQNLSSMQRKSSEQNLTVSNTSQVLNTSSIEKSQTTNNLTSQNKTDQNFTLINIKSEPLASQNNTNTNPADKQLIVQSASNNNSIPATPTNLTPQQKQNQTQVLSPKSNTSNVTSSLNSSLQNSIIPAQLHRSQQSQKLQHQLQQLSASLQKQKGQLQQKQQALKLKQQEITNRNSQLLQKEKQFQFINVQQEKLKLQINEKAKETQEKYSKIIQKQKQIIVTQQNLQTQSQDIKKRLQQVEVEQQKLKDHQKSVKQAEDQLKQLQKRYNQKSQTVLNDMKAVIIQAQKSNANLIKQNSQIESTKPSKSQSFQTKQTQSSTSSTKKNNNLHIKQISDDTQQNNKEQETSQKTKKQKQNQRSTNSKKIQNDDEDIYFFAFAGICVIIVIGWFFMKSRRNKANKNKEKLPSFSSASGLKFQSQKSKLQQGKNIKAKSQNLNLTQVKLNSSEQLDDNMKISINDDQFQQAIYVKDDPNNLI